VSDWARGCGEVGGNKEKRAAYLVPLLLSTCRWEFVGHLILLPCTHTIEKGNGVLVVISLWSSHCRVPTSLNEERRGNDVAALWSFVAL